MARAQIAPLVRSRSEADLSACERLARAVHVTDGYPVFVPGDDFRGFLTSPPALAAWVAVADAEIIGHVALHPPTSLHVARLVRSQLGVEAFRLGVIARLFVAPSTRRRGVARTLMDVAQAEADRRELVPIVDVVTRHEPAVALYDNAGWMRLGKVDVDLPDGTTIEEFVYRSPLASPSG
jgi:GNAT superfamily N-acetyltransferase